MRGLKSVILGSIMIGSGSTLLLIDFWLKENKHYILVKKNSTIQGDKNK